jgi:hypothetical protein
MIKKWYLMFGLVFLSLSVLPGYMLPESSLSGECTGAGSAIGGAMGNCTVMTEAWLNPGLLTRHPGLGIIVAGGFAKAGERRKKSIFDTFDNRVGDVTVADNSYVFCEPTYVALAYCFPFNVGIGVQLLPVMSFDYRYQREIRDNFYVLEQTIDHEESGKLYAGNIGIAYEVIHERVSAGFGFNLYSGQRDYSYREDFVNPSEEDLLQESSRTLSGNGFTFGLHAIPMERIRLGGFLSAKALVGNYSSDELPLRMGGGFSFIPPNEFPAIFMVEFVFERWNEVDERYYDALKFHLGVEHAFSPSLMGRFGFGYETSYISLEMPRTFFTFGMGFRKGQFLFDACLNARKANFSNEVIPRGLHDMEDISLIEESLVKVLFTVSYYR